MRALPVRRSRAMLVVALAMLVLAPTVPSSAMTLVPLGLAELTGGAGRIFVARVERVEAGRDAEGLPAVWTTFAVSETLKGPASEHVTLKQLGTSFGGADARIAPHADVPRYEPGESVVLFVHPESTLGFTSPVGLGQGCFRIRDRDGTRVAVNDVGNRNLVAPAGAARTLAGPDPTAASLPLATLIARVRGLVAGPP
jgi:hypothetical protein